MSTRGRTSWYRPVDAAVLRASAHTRELVDRPWPDLDDAAAVEQWCAWLAAVWAQPPVAEAVAVASPALAERIAAVCAGRHLDAEQVRRLVIALARYLVRMRDRATPFGLFAGVAPVRFGSPVVRYTPGHRHWLRADAVWLAKVVAELEGRVELRRRLRVVVNDLVAVRGGRLIVAWQPAAGDADRSGPVEVSVRYSPAVRLIMEAAAAPVRAQDLLDKLAAEFATALPGSLDGLLARLLSLGVLISELRPPSTSTDGLGHVVGRLRRVDAAGVWQAAPLVAELRAIHAQLRAASRAPSGEQSRARQAAARRMSALAAAAGSPLMVDLRLAAAVTLPPSVGAEAAAAAEALLRLSPAPAGLPGWRAYHRQFVARYGPGGLVPVAQLVEELGLPEHFTAPVPAAGLSRRDAALLVLAQQAAAARTAEVVLDEARLRDLAGDVPPGPVPHVDVCVEVHAQTAQALDAGAFTLTVCGLGRSGASVGRFLDLLPPHARRRVAAGYRGLPGRVDGALVAQLSCPPARVRQENAARATQVWPLVLALGEHRGESPDRIAVADLAVTADADRLYLLSVSRQRIIEPVLPHAAARHTLPPLGRLLLELPRAAGPAVTTFDWGAAGCLPFLPRLRYGRAVLAPARWQLPTRALPGPEATRRQWTVALAALRDQLCLPQRVSVGAGDQQLRLDLDDPMDAALLRAYLDTASGTATLTEAPPASGWLSGRAHEVVVPLAATTAPARPPAAVADGGPLHLVDRAAVALPGAGRVLLAKLFGAPELVDEILQRHLPHLLDRWPVALAWSIVRYRHPAPHLRLRLYDVDDYGLATTRIGRWAAELRRSGLIVDLTLDTHRPETGRYGGGPAGAAADALFCADSTAAVTQIAATAADRAVHPWALTAASLADLAAAMTGSRAAGMRWLLDHPDLAGRASVRDRQILRQSVALAAADAAAPGGEPVVAAWHARRRAAADYAAVLTADAGSVTPAGVLGSLLHMHVVRVHGIAPDTEQSVRRLARAIALAWRDRPDGL